MGIFSKLFERAPRPLSGETTAFDLAKFLAYDFRSPSEQWIGDTCLRAEICAPNAKFVWEAMQAAKAAGDESFMRGALFTLQLVGANAATRSRLAMLMKGG